MPNDDTTTKMSEREGWRLALILTWASNVILTALVVMLAAMLLWG